MYSGAKNIVICSDGTGNTTIKDRGTNVFKLFEAVDVNGHRRDPRAVRQLAFYDDGVGTETLKWLRAFAGATGFGLSRNVKQLYGELCRVYEPGDAVYLFGFSRGAFTVRTLAGLINDCGILDARQYATEDAYRRQVRAAYRAYRRKYRALLARAFSRRTPMNADEFKMRFARADTPPRPIRFLGVWDTVDAVGLPFRLSDALNRIVWQFKFETSTLGDAVEQGCHALALDDERAAFSPVLWDERHPSTRERVQQVWFAGAHANVGGGYPQQGMSLVALDWMMTQAEAAGLRFVRHVRDEYATIHSFADKLYDPRSGFGLFYRWQPRDAAGLCARRGIPVPAVHVSAIERILQAPEGYAPGNIPPRMRLVATDGFAGVPTAAIEDAIARAHGGAEATPLNQRARIWVWIGLAGYLSFILGTLVALLRVGTLAFLFDARAFAAALLGDPIAAGALGAGLACGYGLTAWSAARARRTYSEFWHRHYEALRTALGQGQAAQTVGAQLNV